MEELRNNLIPQGTVPEVFRVRGDTMDVGTEELPPDVAAWQLATASWSTHVVTCMATLELPDHLAHGPRTVEELAAATRTHAPTLRRLVRALTSLGLCSQAGDGRIELTPVGTLFRSDVPGSIRPFTLGIMTPHIERAWHALPEAVASGDATFPGIHGQGFWDYLQTHPDEGARFDAAMSGGADLARMLLATRDLSTITTLVDIGGGQGRLLAAALAAQPALQGILFDQPDVVGRAEPVLSAAGVQDRCTLVGGSFFESVPEGGDAYVMASNIHDWPDEQALLILGNCYEAMRPGARIWLIEHVMTADDTGTFTSLLDLLMLVLFGAEERTSYEYHELLETAGFEQVTTFAGDGTWGIIEATRP
jgi:hypothetical protein